MLVAVGTVAMVLGRRAIRRGYVGRHRTLMGTAVVAHAGFLVVFVWRFVRYGFAPFEGTGLLRWTYLGVFFTHEPIAVVSIPLVLVSAALALAGRITLHRQIAPMAYAAWLYASATGLALYALLYLA